MDNNHVLAIVNSVAMNTGVMCVYSIDFKFHSFVGLSLCLTWTSMAIFLNDSILSHTVPLQWAFLVAPMVKSLPAMWETSVQFPESGRSPGEGNGSPLQDSCLEYPMDRVIWWAIALGVHTESDTTEGLTQNTSA